jgi:large conductance mechanosensitive channel protein
MALIIFIMIKAINSASEKFSRKEKEKPTTKTCPYCKTKIAIDAVRCPNCTSHLEDGVSKS